MKIMEKILGRLGYIHLKYHDATIHEMNDRYIKEKKDSYNPKFPRGINMVCAKLGTDLLDNPIYYEFLNLKDIEKNGVQSKFVKVEE